MIAPKENTEQNEDAGSVDWASTKASFAKDIDLYTALSNNRNSRLPPALRALTSRGLWLLLAYRISRLLYLSRKQNPKQGRMIVLARIGSALLNRICNVLSTSEFREDNAMEGGIYLSDQGELIIAPEKLGAECIVHHAVTIGMGLTDGRRPRIGNRVWIGPESLIYGNISIGDGATILPGTVLSKSIPADTVVQGNPARVVARNIDNSILRRSNSTDISAFLDLVAQQKTRNQTPDA